MAKYRVGEAILLSLVSLGDGDLAKLDPSVFGLVLKVLRAVGLEKEAKSLAIEGLLEKGL